MPARRLRLAVAHLWAAVRRLAVLVLVARHWVALGQGLAGLLRAARLLALVACCQAQGDF
jgi:hypothetical protein